MRLYGREWGDTHPLHIELACFREDLQPKHGGLGKAEHFWNVVKMLWPAGGARPFLRNPWSEKMIEAACNWSFLSVSGPASASKSETYAAWGLVNYLADPFNTMVLVTSTSLKDARRRIWGSITDFWRCSAIPLWGKEVESIGQIRAEFDGRKGSDRCGLALISGEKKKEKESVAKLIGIKNNHVILIGDELPELSHGLVNAGVSNLSSNPKFQFVGIGNPNSRFDPHGQLSEPVDGWKSIDESYLEWKTKLGYAIRFDGERSPNILAGRTIFPFLPTKEKLEEKRGELGESSLMFWRMWKGFWCPEGAVDGIYTEVEISSTGSSDNHVDWQGDPIRVAGLDLGFTTDGDASQLVIADFGTDLTGRQVLRYQRSIRINDDQRIKIPRNQQIISQIIGECSKAGVTPDNFAMDVTGGGIVFAEMLEERWKHPVHRVNFAGGASDLTVLQSRNTPAHEIFADRVSELWGVGLNFLRGGQLRGIRGTLAKQMTSRLQTTVKRNGDLLVSVESKRVMRKRTGESPDVADAAFITLDLCRAKFAFRAVAERAANDKMRHAWTRIIENNQSAMTAPRVGNKPGRPPRKLHYVPIISQIGGGWGNQSLR